jgi:hypothetical protein
LLRRCSPNALRTATASGSRSRARVHRPGVCSPPLLIDGCATDTTLRCTESREAGSFAWRSAARRGHQRGFCLNDERIGASAGGGWRTWGRESRCRVRGRRRSGLRRVEEAWRAVTTPPLSSRARVGRDTRLWADMGYWQAGPSLILFPKFQNQHKLCNSI